MGKFKEEIKEVKTILEEAVELGHMEIVDYNEKGEAIYGFTSLGRQYYLEKVVERLN